MPKVTVYIRKDDMPKWKAIEKKTEFMHNALIPLNSVQGTVDRVKSILSKSDKAVALDIKGVVKGSDFIPKPKLGECLRHHVDKSICHCV